MEISGSGDDGNKSLQILVESESAVGNDVTVTTTENASTTSLRDTDKEQVAEGSSLVLDLDGDSDHGGIGIAEIIKENKPELKSTLEPEHEGENNDKDNEKVVDDEVSTQQKIECNSNNKPETENGEEEKEIDEVVTGTCSIDITNSNTHHSHSSSSTSNSSSIPISKNLGDNDGGGCSSLVQVEEKLTNSNSNDIDLVDKNLYLGNANNACDIKLLKRYKITHILTIDSCPLPYNITHLPHVQTKYIQISDMAREDILKYFGETYEFVNSAVEHGNNVLVHCYFGVSRSATVVLAYLIKKYEISLEVAQERLKAKRSIICPNYGFMSQLKLFEIMKFKIDKDNLHYKRFRLQIAGDNMKSVKILPPPFITSIIKADPAILTTSPDPVNFKCKKCRRILASASNLLTHSEKKTPIWFDFSPPTTLCTQMIFVEPINWMPVTHQQSGKLICPNPNCKSKLGSFSWILGIQCPCGAKIQPAFYLVPNKVDKSNSVLNITITL